MLSRYLSELDGDTQEGEVPERGRAVCRERLRPAPLLQRGQQRPVGLVAQQVAQISMHETNTTQVD